MTEAISTPETAFMKAKKTIKFVKRHVFTLFILSFIVHGIFKGYTVQGENACGFLLGAILLDWAKQFMKPSSSSHKRSGVDDSQYLHQQWWNPSISGTPAHHIENMGRSIRYD